MTPNPDLISRDLKADEGEEFRPYIDTKGFLSTGIGHCLDTNPFTQEEVDYIGHDGRTQPLTDAQAVWLLQRDLAKTYSTLDTFAPWWRNLDEVRCRVLAEMCFNMGWGNGSHGLSSFHRTLNYIQQGTWYAAHDAMLASGWAGEVGHRATRLANMIQSGMDIAP